MTTNTDIIRRAHRLLGTLAAGQVPDGTKTADGMERLQSVILDQPGLLLRSFWNEVAASADYTAKEGDRITVAAGDITLPTTITDDGDARPPKNFARVHILGDVDNAGLWVWVSSLGEWRQVDGLASGDDFPFGAEDVDGMAAQLAAALQPEYGASYQLQPAALAKASQSVAAFRSRYIKAQPKNYSRPQDYPAPEQFADDYA